MEQLDPLQLARYESLITQIEEEYADYEELKRQVELLTNKLRVMKILTRPDFARSKLFHVRVKLFDDTYQLFDVFPNAVPMPELRRLQTYENVHLYLVEIFVSQTFHEKLIAQNWLLCVSVSSGHGKVSKSVSVRNRVANPMKVVLPFERCNGAKVVVHLLPDEHEGLIELASIDVDVSYKFSNTSTNTNRVTLDEEVVQINRCHRKVPELTSNPRIFNYSFQCRLSKAELLQTLYKNSYHRLEPNVTGDNLNLKVFVDESRVTFTFDAASKVFKIEASAELLEKIKRYLFESDRKYVKGDFDGVMSASYLKELKQELTSEDLQTCFDVYEKYRKYISFYPI